MDPRHSLEQPEPRSELLPAYCITLNCLLYSRVESGRAATPEAYDEDVDVYLAHLLHAFINPEFAEQSKKFLSRYDLEAFRRLSHAGDGQLRYRIHKTGSDFLLVSLGVFDSPGLPRTPRTRREPVEEAYIGRGRTYYHFAFTCTQHTHRRAAGVSAVLEKLSVGFDRYVRILSHMRGAPLDLGQRLAHGEVYHLTRTVNEAAVQQLIRSKQDELLELYSAWKERPSRETEESLARIVREIRQLNPDFRFELPQRK
jgi:hypothetical protein